MVKVVKFHKFGGPEVLKIENVELPELKANEVLIQNKCIGLNFIDTYHRSGLYPLELPSPLGLEAAGVIEKIGSDVKELKVGDRVVHTSAPIGAYSEKQNYPADKLVKIPDYITDEVAACIMLKGNTAEYLLHRTYAVKKGDRILYHAAAGGLGQIFCQWANALGCEVIGTVGSKEKEEIAKQNGCHHVINYKEKNFAEEIKKQFGENSIDVVYDGVGETTYEGSFEVLKVRGMMVSFGNASGPVKSIDVKKHIAGKGLFFTRPSVAHYTMKREELVEATNRVFAAIKEEKIKIKISKKYKLDEAQKVHTELESRLLTGPAVIIP